MTSATHPASIEVKERLQLYSIPCLVLHDPLYDELRFFFFVISVRKAVGSTDVVRNPQALN